MRKPDSRKRKLFMVLGIVLSLIVVGIGFVGFKIYEMTAVTNGDEIASYSDGRAALLVIDVQNDTVSMPFYTDKDMLIENINNCIDYANESDMQVIYIKQAFKKNTIGAMLSMGKYIDGTDGVEIIDEIKVNSDAVFTKSVSDTFSSDDFENYLIDNHIDTLYLAGADISSCVYKTALGAVNRGYEVYALEDCLFSMGSKMKSTYLDKMKAHGIESIIL